MNPITFGYLLPTFEARGTNGDRLASLIDLGCEAERLGFEAVYVPDSPFQYGVPDPLVVLGALAARTTGVTLASGVLLAGLRGPTLLAQQLATLDALSTGRLRAGLGLGFGSPQSEAQFQIAGMPFATRAARLEESIALMRELWSTPGQAVTYQGTHVSVSELVLSPAPSRAGGPPIWLAGAGARAERRVGRLADGWLPYLPNPADYALGRQRVQDAAAGADRPRAPIAGLYLTVSLDRSESVARRRLRERVESWYGRPLEAVAGLQAMYAGSPEGLGAHLEPYIEAGLEHVVLRVADAPERGLEAAADAIDRVSARGARAAR
jgi:alkanesulfonate monooxygenase SsuD/methylene tetrahydromethanopterin reductase-like flavin-dependent oxidoreductase (luciferase family)